MPMLHIKSEPIVNAKRLLTASSSCAVVGAPQEVIRSCLAEAINAYEGDYSAEQDLRAQQDMAQWAMLTFIVGAGGLLLSGGGLWLLWRSLRQTQEAISIDREVGHAQVRAYLTATPNEIIFRPDGAVGIAKLEIKNTGQSPAYNIRYVAGIFVVPHPIPLERGEIIEADPLESIPMGQTLPAGESMEAEAMLPTGLSVSAEEFGKIMNAIDKKLHVACLVIYDDVFKKDKRITKICCYYDFTGEALRGPKGKMLRQSGWMSARSNNDAT